MRSIKINNHSWFDSIGAQSLLLLLGTFFLLTFFSCEHAWSDDKQPLLDAARDGNLEQVTVMIREGANVNQADESGYTPLMWAARYNYQEIAEQLIKAGAQIGVKNNDGLTAVQIAARFDNFKLSDFIKNSYRPFIENLPSKIAAKPSQSAGTYDKDQDGILDNQEKEYVSLLPKNKTTIRKILSKCGQGNNYSTIATILSLHKNKWRWYKVINDNVVISKRKRYEIEINFLPEGNHEEIIIGYREKQGRPDILRTISSDIKVMHAFLCRVQEVTDKSNMEKFSKNKDIFFEIPVCTNQKYTTTAIILMSLRKNNWKNIRIHNQFYISADSSHNGFHSEVMIKINQDWQAGRISISGMDLTPMLEHEDINGHLDQYKRRLNTYIVKYYKILC